MDELMFDGKKYISAKRAAEMTGYTNDYIGQLCRAGKLDAKTVGRIWYVNDMSLLNHKEANKKMNEANAYSKSYGPGGADNEEKEVHLDEIYDHASGADNDEKEVILRREHSNGAENKVSSSIPYNGEEKRDDEHKLKINRNGGNYYIHDNRPTIPLLQQKEKITEEAELLEPHAEKNGRAVMLSAIVVLAALAVLSVVFLERVEHYTQGSSVSNAASVFSYISELKIRTDIFRQ
jgi:hypothetical protein